MSRLSLKNTIEKVINNSLTKNLFLFFLFLLFNIILIINFFDKHKVYVFNLNISINSNDLSLIPEQIFIAHLQPEVRKLIDNSMEDLNVLAKKNYKNIIFYHFTNNNNPNIYIRTNNKIDLQILYNYFKQQHEKVVNKFIKSYSVKEFEKDIKYMSEASYYDDFIYKNYWNLILELKNYYSLDIFHIKNVNYKYITNYLLLIILNSLLFYFFYKKSKFNI